MAGLTLTGVSKAFGPTLAVDDVSLEVADGEFLAVLGPSGCGKTTLLRLIAGFESVTAGAIHVGGHLVSDSASHVPPERRRMGIVFQSYALWPHMSVAENVGYALKVQGLPRQEREARVVAALATVGLSDYAERRPAMLSGGQRQRVALARCLAMEPSLVLLDEPLANLDVHLRASMQDEFAAFHRRSRKTMLYITHDQAEAMALADRIAVMDNGRILQSAPPAQLYREPANATVASFIGEGMVTQATVIAEASDGRCAINVFGHRAAVRCGDRARTGDIRELCLRPQGLSLSAKDGIAARLTRLTYQGGRYRGEAAVEAAPEQRLRFELPDPPGVNPGDALKLAVSDGWLIPNAA